MKKIFSNAASTYYTLKCWNVELGTLYLFSLRSNVDFSRNLFHFLRYSVFFVILRFIDERLTRGWRIKKKVDKLGVFFSCFSPSLCWRWKTDGYVVCKRKFFFHRRNDWRYIEWYFAIPYAAVLFSIKAMISLDVFTVIRTSIYEYTYAARNWSIYYEYMYR